MRKRGPFSFIRLLANPLYAVSMAEKLSGALVGNSQFKTKHIYIGKLTIDLLRDGARLQQNFLQHQEDHWGTVVDLMMIELALIIGQVDEKPMSATKVSQYIGIPRPSVIRKINQLVESGMVERLPTNKFRVSPSYLRSRQFYSVIEQSERLIHRTAVILSKMDT